LQYLAACSAPIRAVPAPAARPAAAARVVVVHDVPEGIDLVDPAELLRVDLRVAVDTASRHGGVEPHVSEDVAPARPAVGDGECAVHTPEGSGMARRPPGPGRLTFRVDTPLGSWIPSASGRLVARIALIKLFTGLN